MAYVALFQENGISPSKDLILHHIGQGQEYEYLIYLSEIGTYLKNESYTIDEFK